MTHTLVHTTDDSVCPIYHYSMHMSPVHSLYGLLDSLDAILNPPKYYHGVQSFKTAICLSYERRGDYWDNPYSFKDLYHLDIQMKSNFVASQLADRKLTYCMPQCLFGVKSYNQPCLMQFGNMNRGYFLRHVVFQKYEKSPTHCWETENGEYIMLPQYQLEDLFIEDLHLLGISS